MSRRKKKKNDDSRIGALAPRYLFCLNPYEDARFTRCPKCEGLARLRKFPLAIHVDDFGMFVLNKTVRFCPGCELMIVHRDELEDYLAAFFQKHNPDVIGNDYLVVGTLDRPDWQRGARGQLDLEDMLQNLHDFKQYVKVKPVGGWVPRQ